MVVTDYRTRDGLADYGFSIEFHSDAGWRVYIIFAPFLQGHHDSLDLPHQSIDRDGRRYVDWPSKLNSLGEAKTVAALWAELAQHQRTQQQREFNIERCNDAEWRNYASLVDSLASFLDLEAGLQSALAVSTPVDAAHHRMPRSERRA